MRSILIVDDDADLRLLLSSVLERKGFRVDEVTNGIEALARLAVVDELPALIVLDVQMPELDGWDTLASLRLDPRTRTVPVIMCTVRASAADVERAWSLGSDAVVTKPFAIAELAETAARLVEARRAV